MVQGLTHLANGHVTRTDRAVRAAGTSFTLSDPQLTSSPLEDDVALLVLRVQS